MTNKRDGTYEAWVLANENVGTSTVTATAGTGSDTATLTQTLGPAQQISMSLDRTLIQSDGQVTATARVTLKRYNGTGVPGQTVTVHKAPAIRRSDP